MNRRSMFAAVFAAPLGLLRSPAPAGQFGELRCRLDVIEAEHGKDVGMTVKVDTMRTILDSIDRISAELAEMRG